MSDSTSRKELLERLASMETEVNRLGRSHAIISVLYVLMKSDTSNQPDQKLVTFSLSHGQV